MSRISWSRIIFIFFLIAALSFTGCSGKDRYDTGTFSLSISEGWKPFEDRFQVNLYGSDLLKIEKISYNPMGEGKFPHYPFILIERHDKGFVKKHDDQQLYSDAGTVKISGKEYDVTVAQYMGSVYQYITYETDDNIFIVHISLTLEGKFIDMSFEDADIQKMIISLK